MIEAAVKKRLGGFSLDARLSDGGFICLTGKNGSGKTSLLRIVGGLLTPDAGHVKVNGRDLTRMPVERRGVVMITPDPCIPSLEVDAHILWGDRLKGTSVDGDKVARMKKELGIDFHGPVGKLSLGMRERVALVTALLSSPAGVLVDEAFSSLHAREQFIASYRRLASDSGIDVIFSTQDDSDGRLAEHLYLMEEGKSSRKF
jgi:molybdate/tungstate transport system ATP-binding protein